MYDVIVIGGGPAGLQAALTLGRMHRSTLLLDSGTYRNASATHMHNMVTQDGRPPAEFRADARAGLTAYDTVEVREATATATTPADHGFAVHTAGGTLRARRLILAGGVRDTLPDVPGLAALWGDVVAHCPFCHGHEVAGGTVALLGGPHAARLASMLGPVAGRLVVLDAEEVPDGDRDGLLRAGVELRTGRLVAAERADGGALLTLDGDAGDHVRVDGLFVSTTFEPNGPFVADLDLRTLDSGCIEIDVMGRTSRPGVYAAGDVAHVAALPMPMASVLTAAAAGLVAAAACTQDLALAP